MKIERHLRYRLEMEPTEYRLLCEGMLELEAAISPTQSDYPLIAKMEEQLGRGETECVQE